jgi:addiction module HigA family antidote
MTNGESALNGGEERPVHQMSKSLTTIRRNVVAIPAIHPGEHLAEELKELGISAAELGRQLGVPTNRVTEILNGTRAITGDTALRLAHFFGTTGWRLHYCVSRTMGGSTSAENCLLLHPECHDRVHRLRLSVSKPRLL